MDGAATFPTDTKTPSAQLSRDLILDATWGCLHTEGYDGTTIRRIAGQLGCSVGSIYRYFKDKHELMLAVTQRMLEPVREHLQADGDFQESVRIYHQQANVDPEAYRLMFWLAGSQADPAPASPQAQASVSPDRPADGADANPPLPPVVSDVLASWANHLGDAILARQCWALLHGAVMLGQPVHAVLEMFQRLAGQTPAASIEPTPVAQSQPFATGA